MFHQADLFDPAPVRRRAAPAMPSLADLVGRIAAVTRRPRYALLVLDLIAREAGANGSLGPHVATTEGRVPVRDWLCVALAPLAERDCRRIAMAQTVRAEIMATAPVAADMAELEGRIAQEVQTRIIRSGRTSVSRAVSDLVKAGLLRRHYQGYRVDHPNRGAQREAVYTLTQEARRAFAHSAC